MHSRSRTLWVAALILGAATARSASAQETMCPKNVVPDASMDDQRAKLERALTAAESSIDLFRKLKAEHESGQTVWGFLQATDPSVALITLVLDTVKTSSNLMRDLAGDLDTTTTIQRLSFGLEAAESAVESAFGKESECELGGSLGEKTLRGFVASKTHMSTATDLAVNTCETFAHQTAHSKLVEEHRAVLSRFEAELVKWAGVARTLRAKLAMLEAKRRGVENQCLAEKQRKLAEFAMKDGAFSKGIESVHSELDSSRRGRSTESLGQLFQGMQLNQQAAAASPPSRPSRPTARDGCAEYSSDKHHEAICRQCLANGGGATCYSSPFDDECTARGLRGECRLVR